MTKEQFDMVKDFVLHLPQLRTQVSDGQLLDRCQQALGELIAAYEFEAQENETRFPAHAEAPHLDEEALKEWAKPGEVELLPPDPPIPPQLHRQPGPPPEPAHHIKKAAPPRSHHKKR